MLGEAQEGRIITRYSIHADVEDSEGHIFRCNLRRTLSNLVVGDRVIWRKGNTQRQGINGVIEAIHPRINEITRPDYYDGLKRRQYRSNYHRLFRITGAFFKYYRSLFSRL